MTVSSSNAVVVHITNTSVTQYSFNFMVFNASELLVTLPAFEGSPNESDEEMLLNTHYIVTGVGDEDGGYIVLTTAGINLAYTGKRLVIRRNMPFVQDTKFEHHSIMPAVLVTRSFDIATMERQELRAKISRAILADESVTNPIPYSEFVALHDAAVDAALDATNAAKAAEKILADIEALGNAIQSGVGDVEGMAAQIAKDIAQFRADVANIESSLTARISVALDHLQMTEENLWAIFKSLELDLTRNINATIESANAVLAEISALRDEIQAIIDGLDGSGVVVLAASQTEVDAGTVTDKYVNPLTLNNWSKLAAISSEAQGMADLAFTNATAWAAGQVDALSGQIAMKAPLASPALTGTPTATTPPAGNDSTRIPTTAWVNSAIATHNTSSAAHSALFAGVSIPSATTTVAGTVTLATAADVTSTTNVPPSAVVQQWLAAVDSSDQAASIAALQTALTAVQTSLGEKASASAFNTSQQMMHVYDRKGGDGGTFTSGAWRTRDLNTIGVNTITGASLASNRVILPAGTYFITGYAPARNVGNHKARLYNVTTAAAVAYGQNQIATEWSYTSNTSTVKVFVTFTVTTTIELQHQCAITFESYGFGQWTGFGEDEIYAMLTVRRIS